MCKCVCVHDYDHGKYEQLCQLLACYPQVGGSMYERGKEEGERQVENEIKHSPVILHCVCVTVAVHVHEKKLYLWEITYMFMLRYVIKRKLQVDIYYLCLFQRKQKMKNCIS